MGKGRTQRRWLRRQGGHLLDSFPGEAGQAGAAWGRGVEPDNPGFCNGLELCRGQGAGRRGKFP